MVPLTSRGPVRPYRTLVPAAVEAWAREQAAQRVERIELPGADSPAPAAEQDLRRVAGAWSDARVTLLGTGSALPSKYRNVSAILVRAPGTSLLLDCGEGSYGQLLRACGGPDAVARVLCGLRTVVISHMHADHHMGTLRVLLERARAAAGEELPPLDLVGPLALGDTLRAWEAQFPQLQGAVRFTAAGALAAGAAATASFDPEKHAALAARSRVRIDTAPATHIFDSHAVALRPEGATEGPPALVYSGDTRPCAAVVSLAKASWARPPAAWGRGMWGRTQGAPPPLLVRSAHPRGADPPAPPLALQGAALLIHEATFGEGKEHEAVARRHSTAAEALQVRSHTRTPRRIGADPGFVRRAAARPGQVARDAGAVRLCLTHFSQRYAKFAPGRGDALAFVGADLMTFRIAEAAWLPSVSNSVAAALQPEGSGTCRSP